MSVIDCVLGGIMLFVAGFTVGDTCGLLTGIRLYHRRRKP
jgi:hypothetical protein